MKKQRKNNTEKIKNHLQDIVQQKRAVAKAVYEKVN